MMARYRRNNSGFALNGRTREQKVIKAALIGLCFSFLLPLMTQSGAMAARITPGIRAELGYTDDLSFRGRSDLRDGFLRLTPSVRMETGTPAHNFNASLSAGYTRYLNNGDESEFETFNLNLEYRRQHSPRFSYFASNTTSSSFDSLDETAETGELVRIDDFGRRTDSNVTRVGANYMWSPFTSIGATYSFGYSRTEGDVDDDVTRNHRVTVNGSKRFNQDWRGEIALSGGRNSFTGDDDRNDFDTTVRAVYMIGPSREVYASATYETTISLSDDPAIADSVDFDRYEARVGFDYGISPEWFVGASAGVSFSDTDDGVSPVYSAYVTHNRPTWSVSLRGEVEQSNIAGVGRTGGLTETRRANLSYTHQLAPHWSFGLRLGFVHELPAQNIAGADPESMQYRFSANLNWQTSQYTSLGLSYVYINVDSENDADSGSTNEISLVFNYAQPYLW
jgi:hypothetical protein